MSTMCVPLVTSGRSGSIGSCARTVAAASRHAHATAAPATAVSSVRRVSEHILGTADHAARDFRDSNQGKALPLTYSTRTGQRRALGKRSGRALAWLEQYLLARFARPAR